MISSKEQKLIIKFKKKIRKYNDYFEYNYLKNVLCKHYKPYDNLNNLLNKKRKKSGI